MKKIFIKSDHQEQYNTIPQWAESFVQTGKKVATMIDDECSNIVIGFSLPTRSYAMLFFLLGYESWLAEKEFTIVKQDHSYFKKISESEQDEALLLLDNKHWKRCWYKGTVTIEGNKLIKVDVPGSEKAKHTRYISMPEIVSLRKAVDPERKVAANQTGFGMKGFETLVEYYNRKDYEILQFLINGKPSYVVFGSKSIIEKEVKQMDLFCISDNEHMKMPIQHILRFKNLMTDFDLYRGNIFSSKEYYGLPTDMSKSPIVIYDSSLAYLNREGTIQSKIEIIL